MKNGKCKAYDAGSGTDGRREKMGCKWGRKGKENLMLGAVRWKGGGKGSLLWRYAGG